MFSKFKKIPNISLSPFVFILCFGNLFLYQVPLITFSLNVSAFPQPAGWLQLFSLQVIQIFLLATLLFFVSVISIKLLKLISMVLALTNSAALYFMMVYNMELDRSMISNILNTDTNEASGLWHISILPYLFFLGVLPCLFIWRCHVLPNRRIWRFTSSCLSFLVLFGWIFSTASTWLWFDKHASRMGSKILPWSYIVNTARHYNQMALKNREQILLPDANFLQEALPRKQVVVLVIGEAARAQSFSLYGYEKETNPFTKKKEIIALPIGNSCATNTISSTACILIHKGREASSHSPYEPLPSYLTRHGVETIYRTNNSGPPPVHVNSYEKAVDIADNCKQKHCPSRHLDEALNWQLKEILDASESPRIFVTLHQSGSHGPAYSQKHPASFAHFTPECQSVQLSSCARHELLNAYDNTIRYTDYLLADLITQLENTDADSVLIYVPDHGQSLGESGFYLHGAPMAIAPKEQREIPFLLWMSKGFQNSKNINASDILVQETYPHDFPFHSVMGAFGMRSDIYKPQFDLFNLNAPK